MLTWVKAFNLVMTVVDNIMGMIRNEELRQSGRDQVAAGNAKRLIKARDKAHAKVQSFDDAIAVANSKLQPPAGDDQ